MKTRESDEFILTILGIFGCRGTGQNPSLQGLAQLQHSEMVWGVWVPAMHPVLEKATVRFWLNTHLSIPNMLPKLLFLKVCSKKY